MLSRCENSYTASDPAGSGKWPGGGGQEKIKCCGVLDEVLNACCDRMTSLSARIGTLLWFLIWYVLVIYATADEADAYMFYRCFFLFFSVRKKYETTDVMVRVHCCAENRARSSRHLLALCPIHTADETKLSSLVASAV